jgi:hypothetical protein
MLGESPASDAGVDAERHAGGAPQLDEPVPPSLAASLPRQRNRRGAR